MPNYFGQEGGPRGLGQKRTDEAKEEAWARKYHSRDRVLWMQRQPSILSGEVPCVNAHVGIDGMGRKSDYTKIIPLTKAEHDEIEKPGGGIMTFCAKYSVTIEWLLGQAAEIERRWQEHQAVPRSW